MGYSGKLAEKQQAQYLRSLGYSYNRILLEVHVSKNSVSRWCKDISLTQSQKEQLLVNKSFGQRKGSLVAAENKKILRNQQVLEYLKAGQLLVGTVSKREEFLMGLSLYVAEGEKSPYKGGFANSDPKLILFMMRWFREHVLLPENKFRGAIWIHDNLDANNALLFWSGLTKIPVSQFHKTYIVKNKISNKVRKKRHEYGVFSIRFSDSKKQRQILGWISGAFIDKIPE